LCGKVIVGYASDEITGGQIERLLTVELFSREGCPHCAQARRYLPVWQRRYPAFRFVEREIVRDTAARARLEELVRARSIRGASVPTFHFGDELIVGFFG